MGDEEAGHPNPNRNIIQKIRPFIWNILQVIVCVGFLAILLGTSVRLRHQVIWIFELWKWCVLMLVIVGGWILLGIIMEGVCFLTEKRFACFKSINVKYIYYIYGTKNHIRVLLWFISIYIAWKLMVGGGAMDNYYSSHHSKILSSITSCLLTLLIGIALWVLRFFFVSLLTSSLLVPTRSFSKIWKSLIDHHILYLLTTSLKVQSGVPDKIPEWIVKMITTRENRQLHAESLTVWHMQKIIEIIENCPYQFSAQNTNDIVKDLYRKIETKARAKAAERSELEAEDKSDDGSDDGDELLSKSLKLIFDEEGEFMVTNISGGVNPKSIGITSLRIWLVNAAKNRNSLPTSLRDAKKAMGELNIVISLTVVIMTIIIWLILMGLLTTQLLIVILTQCAALTFMFGDTAKKVFEGILFVFVAHPFVVGDLCLVQNEEMEVKRICLLTTEFQKKNCNDLVVYPNSTLSSMNITILQEDTRKLRHDDFIYDCVKISIDPSTGEQKLQDLHEKIVSFSKEEPNRIPITDLASLRGPNGEQWFKPNDKFVFKEIEDGKLNLVLYNHYRKLDFDQDNFIKSYVRGALVKKLKRLFDDGGIKYHSIQIQEVDGEEVNGEAVK